MTIVSDGRMTDECWTEDLEGNSHGLTKLLSWHYPGRTEDNYKNLSQNSWCLAEIWTEHLWITSQQHYLQTSLFGITLLNMKKSIFLDVMLQSQVTVTWCFRGTKQETAWSRQAILVSFLASPSTRGWRWHVPPEHWLTFTGIIFQKTELFSHHYEDLRANIS
jgi:hypothetical protein